MRAFSRWLGLALAWGLASCAAGPDPEDFEVTVVNVASQQAGGGGLGEVALTFTLRWQNARPEPVVVTGGAHRVHLNGVYVGQALSSGRVEVPRLSTATEEVTLRLGTWRLARALSAVYRAQQVDYRVTSTLYAEEGGRNRRFRTERQGTVDLSALRLK
ncbi:MAG: LEA type 2 family protein [Verrucomicrobiota bacterium]